ncbi:unnamed protein product [Blepharisma stoltei]|uniref:Triosephosphate isomerase n=1 Tax=Blepharisma stoltei TaxID=1481888 RepID=A0AAU9JP57_9CILI|nr:unnamed protein product [Blepharisma stoltei]
MARRQFFVGGNWKSNGTQASVRELCEQVLNSTSIDFSRVQVVVAPAFIFLQFARSLLRPNIAVSAQNCSLTGSGPFTGEVAVEHIVDLGLNWTILGHSERRNLYGETDDIVSKKVNRALAHGLSVIACFGENLQERKSGITLDVVARQLDSLKKGIIDWNKVVLAYEPVWAIGTGINATPEQAQEVHAMIRNWLSTNVSAEVAERTRVIYGGSVTDQNAAQLISKNDVDGFLVGGASLKPAFRVILEVTNTQHLNQFPYPCI